MKDLKLQIQKELLPKHVAIIMDGNGRWAKQQGQERVFGHKNAIHAVRSAINACNEVEIPYLTLYTFSTENWGRPEQEVKELMKLLSETLLEEADDIYNKGLRLKVIGDVSKLPDSLQEQISQLMELTKNNPGGTLVLALNYGAKHEILEAVKAISSDVKNGIIEHSDINDSLFEDYLHTKGMPAVDLMIRTSGEIRISNFMLWQIAYAELQFLDVNWPDFTTDHFFQAVIDYQKKQRRFGKTSDQVEVI